MTIHTRYRATMQTTLGEMILDLLEIVAPLDPPSEIGTTALHRLEQQGFTLTRLPVDDHAKDRAIWGLIDARDDEADTAEQKLAALEPWLQELTEIMTTIERPTDTETDAPGYPDQFGRSLVACLRSESRAHGDHRGAGGLCGDAADEIDRLRALVGGRSAPTRDEIAEAIAESITEHVWAHGTGEIDGDGIGEAAEAVVALLSRSAAEPPRGRVDVTALIESIAEGLAAYEGTDDGERHQSMARHLVGWFIAEGWRVRRLSPEDRGVAAEPNEDSTDG